MERLLSYQELERKLVEEHKFSEFDLEEGFSNWENRIISSEGSATIALGEELDSSKLIYREFDWITEDEADIEASIAIIAKEVEEDEFEHFYLLDSVGSRRVK